MTASLLVVQVLSGLAHGMGLFLVASGLSLIFGVTRVVNFAHGSLYMLAAYLTCSLTPALPLGAAGFYVAMLLGALAVAGLGLIVEVGLLRRVYRAPELYQLLLTFALVLVISDVVRLVWGPENRTGPAAPGLGGAVVIAGQLFPTYDLALIALGPAVAGALWWLFRRTLWGVRVRAATEDRDMAAALGVDQARLVSSVFALGAFLAGLGGALQVPRQALTTVMDTTVLTEAFVVVVVGGMGSVPGALLASALIGVTGALGVLALPRASLVLPFVVMAIVLVVRPWGLLGRPEPPGRAAAGLVAEGVRPLPWAAPAAALAVLVALPPWLPVFHLWVLVELLTFALYAASLQLLLGTGGMISFGHAATFGLGAYGAALAVHWAGVGTPVAFLAGPGIAALGAALAGAFCVRLSSIYFAMLTLAFSQIAHALAHQWYDVTGGDNGLLGIWPERWLASPLRYYYWALAVCGLGIALLALVGRSPFGLSLRAARDHAPRAEAVGIDVRRLHWVAFVVAGLLGGLAGTTFAFLKGSVFPAVLAVHASVQPLVMVLLGGVGALAGAPLGAAVYTLLDTAVTQATEYWSLVLGAILIVLVVAFPRGLLGMVDGRRRP